MDRDIGYSPLLMVVSVYSKKINETENDQSPRNKTYSL